MMAIESDIINIYGKVIEYHVLPHLFQEQDQYTIIRDGIRRTQYDMIRYVLKVAGAGG